MTVKTGEIHMITKKWDGCRDPSGKGCKTFDGLQISDKWIKLPFFERIALPCMWAHYWMGHFTCKYSTRQYKRHFLQMKLRFVADWELWIWGKYFLCTFSSYLCAIVNTSHPHIPETHQESCMKAFVGWWLIKDFGLEMLCCRVRITLFC